MIMIWGRNIINNSDNSKDRDIYDDFEIFDPTNKSKKVNDTFTKVIHGVDNADKTIIEFVNRASEKIDSYVSSIAPSVFVEVDAIKDARSVALKDRDVKLRYIIEITWDNLNYCKEMLKFSEIRHLEGMKGNFEVADEKEYVAIATP